MKCLSITNLTNQTYIVVSPCTVTEVTIHMIHVISSIGVILNIGHILNLLYTDCKYKCYSFIKCRIFCNLVVCIFGILFIEIIPNQNCVTDYAKLKTNWFQIILPLRAALYSSFVSDILLILNRRAHIYAYENNKFYELSMKVSIFYFDIIKNKFLIKIDTYFI